jgi:hypothetical protein
MCENENIISFFPSISLLKADFHRINQLIDAENKIFEVNICSKAYFVSNEQIILLSKLAFLNISEASLSFDVFCSSFVSKDLPFSCFKAIFSLFSESEEIISQDNVFAFHYLSKMFENSFLLSICENVLSSGYSQWFFFDSDQFSQIPQNIFGSMDDFRILLRNKIIQCNHIFASLISNKIFNQTENLSAFDFVDFSDYYNPETISQFFHILRGNRVEINKNNVSQIYEAISFLEFSSVPI